MLTNLRVPTLCFLTLICFLLPFALDGQNTKFQQDSLQAIEYFNIADTSYMDVDKCIHYTHLAIPLLKKTQQWEKYVHLLAGLSYCFKVKEQYDSLEVNNRLAFAEAQNHFDQNHYLYMATTSNLGMVYTVVRQDYDQALAHYKKALSTFDSIDTNIGFRASILKNIGEIYLKKGDFKRSILYLKEAQTNYEEAFTMPIYQEANIRFRIVEIYRNLARVYEYQQDYPKATSYLKSMLQLMQTNTKAFNTTYYANTYSSLAELALKQDNLKEAKSYLAKAKSLQPLLPQQLSTVNQLESQLHCAQKQWTTAMQRIDEAISLIPPKQKIDLASALLAKAKTWQQQKHYGEALSTLELAITALVPTDQLNMGTLDKGIKINSRLELIRVLQCKAICLEGKSGEEANNDALKEAMVCYLLISKLSDQLRQNYQSEESKIFLNESTHNLYERGLELTYQLYERTSDRQYLVHAFYFFEKSKAAVLLEELKSREAEGTFTIPPELVARAEQLRTDIHFYEKLIEKEKLKNADVNPEKIKNWNSQLINLSQRRDQLRQQLQADFPAYAAYSLTTVPKLRAAQQSISQHHVIVEYFLGTEQSYALWISQDQIAFRQLPAADTIEWHTDKVLSNLKLSNQESLTSFQESAYWLYRQLLSPFPVTNLQLITIVPDGILSLLPFEVLLTKKTTVKNPRDYNYLLHQLNTHYIYSVAVQQVHQINPGNGRPLVIAPIFKNRPKKHLAFGGEQIEAFASIQTRNLLHEEASISNFKACARDYGLLYFYTHATAYDSVLNAPAIELYDSTLHLHDLYALKLSAKLVVLSVCEAGKGNMRKGEGIMSLARGFTYAGVPCVATTLWKVNEQATNAITQQFYHHLVSGMDKAQAMRQAKIDYVRTCADIKVSPYYWAGFVVIGDISPFSFTRSSLWAIFIIGVSAFLGFILIGYYLKKVVSSSP